MMTITFLEHSTTDYLDSDFMQGHTLKFSIQNRFSLPSNQ